ncbi:macrolide-specific efflux system membrane fusion protein [Lentzea atacamensis]|uniref:Macrolide-specific efflux system membrane fusion protein n=1 Tax=Lentzea atacamensis TaxID=531938 RepID=A0A316I4Q6_9PSEU|nr:efflux RND transporter periplasmic adaptor subunit [Lentzea atacamensis]PWK85413.1 macrolide-specific efflux system membrane fusion protein [Lentzea atacamensis]RAS66818.1 macrolide-specific efflux system membrane fusion protein [Lentzea atacamensis]
MTRRRRSLLINGLLVVVLLGAGVAGYLVFFGSSGNAQPTARTATAANRDVSEVVTAAGTVQSSFSATASFGTSGTVTEVNVKVGDAVTKGQQLAKLDPTQAQLQVDIAQGNLDTAALKGTATTAYRQAELALKQAQDALAATTLTAPGDGTITSVTGSVGQKVGGSASGFAVVTDLKNLVLHANVSESDVSKLKADQAATVTVNAMATQPIQAKVAQVDLTPTTSNNVVQYGVTLSLTAPPAGLRPGQSASVEITVSQVSNVLAVPAAAVQTVGNQSTVQVMENGVETRKTVEVGVRGDQYVEIKSGLTAGEEVVLPPVTTSTNTNRQQQQGNIPGTGGQRTNGGFGR